MVSQRQPGGLKTFVDDGTHNSILSVEDSDKIDEIYKRIKNQEVSQEVSIIPTLAVLIMLAIAISFAVFFVVIPILKTMGVL